MATRHEYWLHLDPYQPPAIQTDHGLTLRQPTLADGAALAELMLDAYRGTIDDDGETLEDASAEIQRLLTNEYSRFLPEHSWLCSDDKTILSACLIVNWAVRQVPLIGYVMTSAQAKGKGLAAVVLHRSLTSLKAAGKSEVHAFITEGNTPSERLHRSAGFVHLPYYHWEICPTSVRQQVTTLTTQIAQILGENLVGVYLHGSLSFGCFNPQRSDIDLLVVTERLMTVDNKLALARLLLASSLHPYPVEISFLTRQQLNPWQYPTPFDFHYSEAWRAKTSQAIDNGSWREWQPNNSTLSGDVDLAGHITVLHERGIVLAGEAIASVFPAVPAEDYRDSILRDIDAALAEIEQNPVYAILNTCRTLAWLQDGKIRSKDAGGVWALQHLPSEFHPLIKQALGANRSPNATDNAAFSPQALAQFVEISREKRGFTDEAIKK